MRGVSGTVSVSLSISLRTGTSNTKRNELKAMLCSVHSRISARDSHLDCARQTYVHSKSNAFQAVTVSLEHRDALPTLH